MKKARSREEELERQGWRRKFVASEPRLSEAVALCEESGYEVHLEPLPEGPSCETCAGAEQEAGGECRVCFEGFEDEYRIIYTRPREERPGQ
ncbi:MAG: hypothetical protein JW821_00690 [Deltaproteobacteria bacterium]|nr:hypothetical protein [Deltaproteobacteria bacterium]